MRRRIGRGSRRGGLWLLIAGVAGLLAAMMTVRAASSPGPGGTVLVAKVALPAGTIIDPSQVGEQLIAVPLPAGTTLVGLVADVEQIAGRRIGGPVSAGEPITEALVGGLGSAATAPLAVGERAVPVPASAAGGFAASLVPGLRVDVVASTGEGAAGRTRVVVEDAEVLAVDTIALDSGYPSASAPTVMLRASSEDALRITAALNFARDVRLLVRPAGDVAPVLPPTTEGTP